MGTCDLGIWELLCEGCARFDARGVVALDLDDFLVDLFKILQLTPRSPIAGDAIALVDGGADQEVGQSFLAHWAKDEPRFIAIAVAGTRLFLAASRPLADATLSGIGGGVGVFFGRVELGAALGGFGGGFFFDEATAAFFVELDLFLEDLFEKDREVFARDADAVGVEEVEEIVVELTGPLVALLGFTGEGFADDTLEVLRARGTEFCSSASMLTSRTRNMTSRSLPPMKRRRMLRIS